MTDPPTPNDRRLEAGLLRWIGGTTGFGVVATDANLVVRMWNQWLERQSGIAARDAVGRRLFDVCPEMVGRGVDHYYEDVLTGQVRVVSQRLHDHLIPCRAKVKGAVGLMPQSARIAPLMDGDQVIGTITLVFDVTKRVEAEEELRHQYEDSERGRRLAEQASRAKDEFLATLSHELRNPVNAIMGWTRILLAKGGDERGLQVIDRNVNLMMRMIEDMLDVARILTGQLALDLQPTDFAHVVQSAVDVVRSLADAKHIAIVVPPAPPLPPLMADPVRLEQIALNLLQNAVKFTDEHGRIEVRLAPAGANVELTVADTGRGIDPAFLPHVFERFRQGDVSTSRHFGGLGLGLALVRQLVELHGGSVRALSDGVGRGATFKVVLPGAPSSDLAGVDERRVPADREITALQNLRVLVVDDNPHIRGLVAAVLGEHGAQVSEASSAGDAMEMLNGGVAPQVVIADIAMPGVDGYEFIRQVRARTGASADVPAVALSGFVGVGGRSGLLEAGYDAYLSKPFTPEALTAILVEVMTRRPER